MEKNIKRLKTSSKKYLIFVKWSIISIFIGVILGFVGTAFHFLTDYVIELNNHFSWMIFILPILGLLIVFIYKIAKMENDAGTNVVFNAIHDNKKITIKTAPLIFIGTILTHLGGGSSGREGAALQIGASISTSFAKLFRLDQKDIKILTMCGMSAGFAAIFGTPITAAIFAMEVFSVGVMYYAALLPCTISAFVGFSIASLFGIKPPFYNLINVPDFNVINILRVGLLGIVCALLGIVFCLSIKYSSRYFKKYISNSYIRVVVGGIVIIVLTFLVGTKDYNCVGMGVISEAMNGNASSFAFILKIVFTAITLGAGFKGGEIVPVFFVGATFGNVFGNLIGLSPSFGAGLGLTALFCSVTNCPLTSIMLVVELFGVNGLPMFIIIIAVSYMMSGYYGLYSSQKIMYSKTKNEYIDKYSI